MGPGYAPAFPAAAIRARTARMAYVYIQGPDPFPRWRYGRRNIRHRHARARPAGSPAPVARSAPGHHRPCPRYPAPRIPRRDARRSYHIPRRILARQRDLRSREPLFGQIGPGVEVACRYSRHPRRYPAPGLPALQHHPHPDHPCHPHRRGGAAHRGRPAGAGIRGRRMGSRDPRDREHHLRDHPDRKPVRRRYRPGRGLCDPRHRRGDPRDHLCDPDAGMNGRRGETTPHPAP